MGSTFAKNTPVNTAVAETILKGNQPLSQNTKGKLTEDSDSSLDYGSASDTENLAHDQGLTSPIKISEGSGSGRQFFKSFLSSTSACESLDTSGASIYEDTENVDPSFVFDPPRPKVFNDLTESFESPNITIHGSSPTLKVNSAQNKSVTSLDSLDKTIVGSEVKERLSVSSSCSESVNKSFITNSSKSSSVVENTGIAETNLSNVQPTDLAAEAISELESVVDAVTNCFINNIVSEVRQNTFIEKETTYDSQETDKSLLESYSDVGAIEFESVLVSEQFRENVDRSSNGSILVNDPFSDVEINTFVCNQETENHSDKTLSCVVYSDVKDDNISIRIAEKSDSEVTNGCEIGRSINLNKVALSTEINKLNDTLNAKGCNLNESILLCNIQNNSNTSLINSTGLDETVGGNDNLNDFNSTLQLLNSIESIIEESNNSSKNSFNSQATLSSAEIKLDGNDIDHFSEPLSNISSTLPSLKSSTDSIGVIESRESSVPSNYQVKDSFSVDLDFDRTQDFICGSIDSIGICTETNSNETKIDTNSLTEKLLLQTDFQINNEDKTVTDYQDEFVNILSNKVSDDIVLGKSIIENQSVPEVVSNLNINGKYTDQNVVDGIAKTENSFGKILEHESEFIAVEKASSVDLGNLQSSDDSTRPFKQFENKIVSVDVESCPPDNKKLLNNSIGSEGGSVVKDTLSQIITSSTDIRDSQETIQSQSDLTEINQAKIQREQPNNLLNNESHNQSSPTAKQREKISIEGDFIEKFVVSPEKTFDSVKNSAVLHSITDDVDGSYKRCDYLNITNVIPIECNKTYENQGHSNCTVIGVSNNFTKLSEGRIECSAINNEQQVDTNCISNETVQLTCEKSETILKIKEEESNLGTGGKLKLRLSSSVLNKIGDIVYENTNEVDSSNTLIVQKIVNTPDLTDSSKTENEVNNLNNKSIENINIIKTDCGNNTIIDFMKREDYVTSNLPSASIESEESVPVSAKLESSCVSTTEAERNSIETTDEGILTNNRNNISDYKHFDKLIETDIKSFGVVTEAIIGVNTNKVNNSTVKDTEVLAFATNEINGYEVNRVNLVDEINETDVRSFGVVTEAIIDVNKVNNNIVKDTEVLAFATNEINGSEVNRVDLVDKIIESNIKSFDEIAVKNSVDQEITHKSESIDDSVKSESIRVSESVDSYSLESNKILVKENVMSTSNTLASTRTVVTANKAADNSNELFKVPSVNNVVSQESALTNSGSENSNIEFETSGCKISETPVKGVRGLAKKKTNLKFHQASVDMYDSLDLDQISDPFKSSNKMRMSPPPNETNIDTFNKESTKEQNLNETLSLSAANNIQNFDATFDLQGNSTFNGNHVEELNNTHVVNSKTVVKKKITQSNFADHVFVKPMVNASVAVGPTRLSVNNSNFNRALMTEDASASCSTKESTFAASCDLMGLSPSKGNSSECYIENERTHDVFSPPNMQDELMDVDEDMPSEDLFSDPAAIEYLLNRGGSTPTGHQRRDYSKDSLFVKFDPLVSASTSSTGFVTKLPAGLRTPRNLEHSGGGDDNSLSSGLAESCSSDSSSSAAVMNKTIQSGIMSTGSEQALLNLSIKETPHHVSEKPTQVVTPAINRSQSQAASQLPNKTPPNNSQKGATACASPALLAIDRLISLAPATPPPPLPPPPPPQSINGMDPEVHTELVRVKELWTAEVSASHAREAELEIRLGDLERRLAETEDREKSGNLRLKEVTTKKNQMSVVVEEYERSIASLTHEREALRRQWEAERINLVKERDEATQHLAGVEHSFNDVHAKYERSKVHIAEYRTNMDSLKKTHTGLEDSLRKQEARYDALRQHAMAQIEKLNQEMEVMKRAHDLEVAKMMALLKKSELTVETLQENITQKNKENDHLTEICNGLIQKMSN